MIATSLLAALVLTTGPTPETAAKPPKDKAAETERRFDLDVGGLLQVRYDFDTNTDEHHFGLPRARFLLKGGLPKLLELSLGVDLGDFEFKFVNAYANIRAYKRHLQVRAGRFKRPFLRERLTSAADLVVVDRSILEGAFGDKRDYGAMLHNGLDGDSGIEWAAGIFGDYDANDFSVDEERPEFNPVIALRLGYAMKGLDGYEDVDRVGGGPRVGGSAAALIATDRGAEKGREAGYRLEADVLLRAFGATLGGGFLARSDELGEPAPSSLGGFVATDYFFLQQFDVALRWAMLVPDTGMNHQEVTLAFTAWVFGDHLKLTADGSWLRNVLAEGDDDYRVRLQLQVK